MSDSSPALPRWPSRPEEIANCLSHGIGLLAALIAVPFLISAALERGGALPVVCAGVYGGTVILLYLASTVFHGLRAGRAKRVFEVLDNIAIFLLIAGTYTPFSLDVLRGAVGWSLFGVIWGLALVGVVKTAILGIRYPVLTGGLYLGMGWLVLVVIVPLSARLPREGLELVFAGGLAYSVGFGFYVARRLRYHHLIWHLFVIAGTGCHFLAVLWYAV